MFHFDDDDDVDQNDDRVLTDVPSGVAADGTFIPAHKVMPARDTRLMSSEGRFAVRIETWRKNKGSALGHHFWWFVHNAIAHPMIAVLPIKQTFAFHDYTSDRINCK